MLSMEASSKYCAKRSRSVWNSRVLLAHNCTEICAIATKSSYASKVTV